MDDARALAGWAALLADRTRAGFCLALLDGRAWTVGELARHAGVAMSTASEHLDRLVAGGVLVQHRQGRHRYVSLAGPPVAALIEAMTGVSAPPVAAPAGSLAAVHRRRNLAYARTCYDHLAGWLGVALSDALVTSGWVSREGGLALTERGRAGLASLSEQAPPPAPARPLLRDCLDWTERRPHLAGAVGAAICSHAFAAGWIVRIGSGRAVTVTPLGAAALRERFGLVTGAGEPGGPGATPAGPAGARHR